MKQSVYLLVIFAWLGVSCASQPTEESPEVLESSIVDDETTGLVSETDIQTLDSFEDFDDRFVEAAQQSVVSNYVGKGRAARIVVYFDFDSAFLALDGRRALDSIITDIKGELAQSQSINIRVEGHTDERGSNEYNLALGQRRADSVARYMILQGIAAAQLEAISYGETRPTSAGSGEIVWQENRRVEINY